MRLLPPVRPPVRAPQETAAPRLLPGVTLWRVVVVAPPRPSHPQQRAGYASGVRRQDRRRGQRM